MREVSLSELPEVDLSGLLEEAPPEVGLSDLPEMDLSSLAGEVEAPAGPVPDLPPLAAGSIPPVQFDRNALPPGMAPAQPGASGRFEDPATGHWTPDATVMDKAGAVGKGLLSGVTANTYQPEVAPGTEGYFVGGNIPGMLVGGAASALGGPPGVAGFAYLAFLNDLKARGLDPARLTDPEIQALAAAAGLSAEMIPASFGKGRLQNVVTGAALGAGQNVAQEGVEAAVTHTDPHYGTAALMGGAMGAGFGLVHKPLPRRAPGSEAPRAPAAPQEVPGEVPLSALPEEAPPAAAAPQEPFPDAAVEAAYAAQYEPQAGPASKEVGPPPEVSLSALEEAPAPPKEGEPDASFQEKAPQGREAVLEEALKPEYANLAIRIARKQPNLSEEEARHQAWVLQRGDEEATRRGSGEAVENRRIEFHAPPEKGPVGDTEAPTLSEFLHAQKPKIYLSDDVRQQLGLLDGPAGFKKPRSLKAIREEYGDLFTLDPKGAKLEGLAERIREEAGSQGLQLAGVDAREVSYTDIVNALSEGIPEPRARRADVADEEMRRAGFDEAYLSGRPPDAGEPESGPRMVGKNLVDENGDILFQKTAAQDLFGGEEAPKGAVRPKAEQVDMFGNEGRVASQGPLKGGAKGLEGTPLQRQADEAARTEGQETLLQEGGRRVTDEALAHYGETPHWQKAGYLTPEGKMLNFGNDGREIGDLRRTRGHEDVARFYRGTPAAKARDFFMQEGNIRLFPEANAVEIQAPLHPAQRGPLEAWFKKATAELERAQGGAALHVEVNPIGAGAGAEDVFRRSYPSKTSPQRILADIDAVFAGEKPKAQSDMQAFRSRGDLQQERGKVTQGEISFLDDGGSTVRIFTKYADFSTLMHEYGHWLRRKSMTAAEEGVIRKWLKDTGIKVTDEGGAWTREADESFARAFERYLRDGVSPTPAVKGIFEKLRQFMRLVYKQAKSSVLGKDIPEDVRRVFDQLLGFRKEGEGTLKQEGELSPREKRAELQKKQEASPQAMPLEGGGPSGRPPAEGRPSGKPQDARLSEGVQEFTDKRLANPPPSGRPPASPKPPPGDVGALEARWDVPDETRWDYFLRRIQDKMRPLKLMERAIVKAGRRLPEATDAYLAEELYHGKAGAALRNADKESVEPILKAMKDGGLDLKQVDEFLYARHAPERNAQIARINADPARGSGMTDAQAKAVMEAAKADGTYGKLEALGEQVDAMNKKRLEVLEASGLISEETRRNWETAYDHYVPLKGFAEAADAPQDVLDYHLGKGFDVRGPESKRALGRKTLADSPLATSIAQLNEAIVRAHKNQVSKTFLKLVLDNPNKEIWEVNKTAFKQSLENGQVVQRQVVNKNDPNVVTAKVLGKEYYVSLKPKYTALAQAMKNMGEEKAGFIVQTLGKVNKVLALINTTLSPEFVLSNFLRDAQTAGINMAGENGTKFAAKVAKDALPAMRGVLQGVRESKFLTPSKSVEEWARWYKRFEKAGGKTEYLGLRSIDDIKAEFESKLGESTAWGKSKEGVKWLGRQIEDVNTAVENSIRLSAFKNGVEAGLSEGKAASLAKNLTVNFNRKGELGTLANSLYLFFNANVQGTARIMAAMAKPNTPAGKKLWAIAGGLAASSLGLAEYNRAIAGEDEDGINRYDKIAPFVKERNIIFALPGSKGKEIQFVTIPIPYGYNVFNVIGESISSWMHGGDTLEGGLNIAQAMAGAFNPLGSESSQRPAKWLTKMATPTVADPIVQYAMNEAFTGAPIQPENLPYGTPKPQSQLAFKSVSPMARGVAEKLNELTGGSEYRSGKVDVSPEALEHFVTSYTGSLGKFLYNTLGYIGGTVKGQPTTIEKTPFARRFFMGESDYFDQKTFSDNAREYKPFLEEAKHLEGEDGNKFEAEFGPQIELAQMAQSIQKQVENLNKQAKGIRGDKGMDDGERKAELEKIETEKKKLFREFNREVHSRKKSPPAVPALP